VQAMRAVVGVISMVEHRGHNHIQPTAAHRVARSCAMPGVALWSSSPVLRRARSAQRRSVARVVCRKQPGMRNPRACCNNASTRHTAWRRRVAPPLNATCCGAQPRCSTRGGKCERQYPVANSVCRGRSYAVSIVNGTNRGGGIGGRNIQNPFTLKRRRAQGSSVNAVPSSASVARRSGRRCR